MVIVANNLATKCLTAHLLHHSLKNRISEQDQTLVRSEVRSHSSTVPKRIHAQSMNQAWHVR